MHHYVAIAWHPADQRAGCEALRVREAMLRHTADSWGNVLTTDGLVVYSKTPTDTVMCTYVLRRGHGVIIGRLFSSDSVHHPMQCSELPSNKISESAGEWLLERCWGKYVAILRSANGEKCHILRDCSGHIPAFYVNLHGLYIFFSDVRDLECLDLRFTFNRRYLATFIARQPLHVRETGLQEITELLAGDRVTVTANGASHAASWNPRGMTVTHEVDNYASARDSLVRLTEDTISAWAPLYRRILLSLSGGLDSAIVLGCLKHLGFADRVVCVTQYTDNTCDDERIYARKAAQMAGVTLVELPRCSDGRLFTQKLRTIPRDPRPDISKNNRSLAVGTLNALAEQLECDTIWTGQGGDQIFLQAHHSLAAADYLIQHRLLPWHLPSLVYESALLSRQSVWSVTSQALAYSFRRRKTPAIALGGRGHRFLAKSAPPIYSDDTLAVPWRIGNDRVPPGKLDQLDILLDLLNRHKPLVGLEAPYEQHPLISQPLIEFSLRVPTYYLLHGGRQRGMARDAFASHVPRCILQREDKGSIPDQIRSLLRGSAPLMRESLLDGLLVSLGIIDRTALEGIFRNEETFAKDDLFPILACVAAEAWAEQWGESSVQAAAA